MILSLLNKIFYFVTEYFGTYFLIFLFICGFWSRFMLGKALEEQKLKRESKIAIWGGNLYLISAILIYGLVSIYPIISPLLE